MADRGQYSICPTLTDAGAMPFIARGIMPEHRVREALSKVGGRYPDRSPDSHNLTARSRAHTRSLAQLE